MFKLRYFSKKRWAMIGLMISICLVIVLKGVDAYYDAVPVSTETRTTQLINRIMPKWSDVLFLGIPGLSETQNVKTVIVTQQITKEGIVRNIVMFFTSVDIKSIKSLLEQEVPLLVATKPNKTTVSAMSLPNFPKFDSQAVKLGGKALVGIYHTHTSESYIPISGVSHQKAGQMGDIVKLGEVMATKLEKNGIKTIQSKNINDYPSFMKAYGSSEITAKKMLEENPSIQMLFDVHRDAEKKESVTATINGLQVARILIVVATGQQDLVQPHWQQNHAFAKLIDAKLNQHFPGISRGIQMVDWRYNQQLHSRALLLEIGCHDSQEQEVSKSVEMLADVLTEIFAEGSE